MKELTAAEIKNIKTYGTWEAQLRNEPYSATVLTKNGEGECEFFTEYKPASKWYRKRRTAAGFQCGALCVYTGGKWRVIREDG